MKAQNLLPPAPLKDKKYNVSVFLAGSIEMDVAEKWQDEISKQLEDYPITIFNPRRLQWDNSWKQEVSDINFYGQVNWELSALEAADIIALYFDPKTISPISLLEMGLYVRTGKLIVCCPEGFFRKRNVDITCEKYDVELYNNKVEWLQAVKRRVEHRLEINAVFNINEAFK